MRKVQEVLTAAYAKSKKNQPGAIASEGTELLDLVNRAFRGLWAVTARVNPFFFASSDTVSHDSEGWPRPTDAEAVWRIELDSDRVIVVPLDDRAADPSRPAVYRWGQKYYGAGNPDDPTNEDLDFFFTTRPATLNALTQELDSSWVEAYDELLILEVAIYLAIKDDRNEEVASLRGDRDRWLMLFLNFVEHETLNEVRRFDRLRPFNSPSVVPIASLLAGGTDLEL